MLRDQTITESTRNWRWYMRTLGTVFGILMVIVGAVSVFVGYALPLELSVKGFYLVVGVVIVAVGVLCCYASGRENQVTRS
jgi:cytochrome c biogenesis protein CcdA